MANHNFLLSIFMFLALVSIIPLVCDAIDETSKLHIVYMGSLPKESKYSPTSHHLSLLQQVIDADSDVTNHLVRSYKRSFNGFAAILNNQQREKLASMKDVVSIFPSRIFHPQTTRSWDFIGFGESIKREQTIESDLVVGVIDTGIWPESESFNDQGFGPIPKKWKGICAGGANFTCNKKIIGARWYDSTGSGENDARDLEGHGTHTASTSCGGAVKGASFYGLAQGTARGGVPSARIAAYKVCHLASGCDSSDILASFDDAIADGVDIINLSLGANEAIEIVEDPIAIGAFHAMENGILTVHAAGNGGPITSSVASVAPWLLTVAASTIDRKFIDKLILGNGMTFTGKSINAVPSNGTKFPIAMRNGQNCPLSPHECSCADRKSVNGKIVLCRELESAELAYINGAIGSIFNASQSQNDDVSFVSYLPSLNLDPQDYALVESYTNSTKYPEAEILKSEMVQDRSAPKIAGFSSRGPNIIVPEILKPDISAPGVDILAAFSPQGSPSSYVDDKRKVQYDILSGTSMACPHVAGIAAYVKSFHPEWSPAAIKSAIMTTARPFNTNLLTNDLTVDQFAYGSGNVNPLQAIDPGLVYDISKEDYVQMLCNYGYDANKIKRIAGGNSTCYGASDRSLVKNINYPALVIPVEPHKPFNVKINRTVTNVGFPNSTYKAIVMPNSKMNITVEPQLLSFRSLNEKQSFVVTVVGGAKSNDTVFSSPLIWSDGTHSVRSPIIVQ